MGMMFPGMDPYLETPQVFPGIHGPMAVYLRDQLAPLIRPRYVASVGERVYVEGLEPRPITPDVWLRQSPHRTGAIASTETVLVDGPAVVEVPELEIRQRYVEILDRESGMRVVTVIELLSPSNKYAGPGRESYIAKQQEVLHSDAHLIEIDLLRYGPHVLAVPEALVAGRFKYDYLTSVNRAAGRRNRFEVYPCTIRQPLPWIRVPLAGDDADVQLNLQAALEQAYDAGSYGERINYRAPCEPPLPDADQKWTNELIRASKANLQPGL